MALVQCLLAHGADITALDREYQTTPRVWAETAAQVTNNPACLEVARLLGEKEAEV